MKLRHHLLIAAIGTTAAISFSVPNVLATPQRAAATPAAGSTARTPTASDNNSQNAPNQPNSGQSTGTNRPAAPTNANANTNGINNSGSTNSSANTSNANAANGAAHHEHEHRRSVHNEVMVPLYGYVPYNGLWNEGFGYNNGWYDYSDIGPYVENSNSNPSQVDESGFVSSNTNGEGALAATSPSATTAPAPQLTADAQSARAAMIEQQARIIKEFEAKPEYQSALKNLKQATDDFKAAVAHAHSSLEQTPAYLQASAQQQQAEQKVEAEQASHQIGPTTEASPTTSTPSGSYSLEVTRAAQQKLNAKTQLGTLQKQNLNNNPQVKQARDKLDAAVAAFNAQKAKLTEMVMADKDWKAAKDKYDAASKS